MTEQMALIRQGLHIFHSVNKCFLTKNIRKKCYIKGSVFVPGLCKYAKYIGTCLWLFNFTQAQNRLAICMLKDRQHLVARDLHPSSVFSILSVTMVPLNVHYISNERSDFSLSNDMNDVVIE